jgi:voltage-gated potassium channel
MHFFLDDADSGVWAARYANAMQGVILFSVTIPLLQTIGPITDIDLLRISVQMLDGLLDLIFFCELFARLYFHPARKVFFFNWLNVLDLAAISLFPMRVLVFLGNAPGDLESIPGALLLSILPVVRLLKFLRRWETFHLLTKAVADIWEALPILLFPLVVFTLFFAALVFAAEPRENMPHLSTAAWMSIVTMTTVGYGDVIPQNPGAKCVVVVMVMTSVMYMAMPLGIIGSSFTEVWKTRDTILLMHRTREQLLGWGYTADDIDVLFGVFDKDMDGELCATEFRKMIRAMKLRLTDRRIAELFQAFDDDGSGKVDSKEFVHKIFPEKYIDLYGDEEEENDEFFEDTQQGNNHSEKAVTSSMKNNNDDWENKSSDSMKTVC